MRRGCIPGASCKSHLRVKTKGAVNNRQDNLSANAFSCVFVDVLVFFNAQAVRMGKLYDDLLLKLQRLRGPGKDIVSALTPIFAAMDTSKAGAIDASEFKTCLLALGIKASAADVAELFNSFDRLHLRHGHKVAYAGFLRSLVDELPSIPGQQPQSGPFVSALVKPPPPPKAVPAAVYFPQASFRSTTPGGPKLSDEVRDGYARAFICSFYACWRFRLVIAIDSSLTEVGECNGGRPSRLKLLLRIFVPHPHH